MILTTFWTRTIRSTFTFSGTTTCTVFTLRNGTICVFKHKVNYFVPNVYTSVLMQVRVIMNMGYWYLH